MARSADQHVVWRRAAALALTETIARMGLGACPVCGGGTLQLLPVPALLPIGGLPWSDKRGAKKGSTLTLVVVRCEACGHVLLFDSDKLTPPDADLLWVGPGPEPADEP